MAQAYGYYPMSPPQIGVPQGPGTLPPGYGQPSGAISPYTTGTYAPQPSQQPQVPQSGAPAQQQPATQPYMPPASTQQTAPTGYGGVPVVVGSQPMAGSGVTNNSLNALYAMGTGPVDTSALNSTNAALQQQMQYDMANAAAYGASAAFGQGGAGTPVQMISANNAANAMIPINAQMQQANLSFYNQQSANQLDALLGASQGGLSQQQLALQQQVALQNALFGANSSNLATQNQAFNQGITSQNQAMNMYNSLFNAGGVGAAANQSNLDAMYQMYGTTDPNQILMQMMGTVPMTQQQTTPFNPFSAVGPAMIGYGIGGGFGSPTAGQQYGPPLPPGINPYGGAA